MWAILGLHPNEIVRMRMRASLSFDVIFGIKGKNKENGPGHAVIILVPSGHCLVEMK